jgi:hypothetical protein
MLFGFLYMLAHGASAASAFQLRRETNLDRIRALLDLSGSSFRLMYLSLLVMFLGGIVLGFLGRWWSSGWIWLSLGILIAILVLMSLMASRQFHRIRKAVGLSYLDGTKEHPPVEPASPEEIRKVLSSGRAYLITAIGLGGWTAILWLMVFKPF